MKTNMIYQRLLSRALRAGLRFIPLKERGPYLDKIKREANNKVLGV